MKKHKYDYIVSIGDSCFPSVELIDCDLQKIGTKYPLDQTRSIMWDRGGRGGLSGNVNLICCGFRNFFNLEALEDRGEDPWTHKLWIVNKETGMSFRHDFPVNVPIKDEYPRVLNEYKNRIAAFYRRINNSDRVLFLYMTQIDGFTDEYLVEQHQKLQSRFPKQKIDMLYIMQQTGLAPTEYVERELSEHVTRIDMDVKYTQSKDPGYVYRGNRNVYKQFLERIRYSYKQDTILHNRITRLKWDVSGLSHSAHQRLLRLEARVAKLEADNGDNQKQSEQMLEYRMDQLEQNYSDNLKQSESLLQSRIEQLERDCNDTLQHEREKARNLLFVSSNISYLRFKMYHFLIKKWVHIGEKRKDYAIKYNKTKRLLVNAKKIMKKISKDTNFNTFN